ncbi:MAG: hypothetical protein AAF432_02150 [Planctomycetota bacterium]
MHLIDVVSERESGPGWTFTIRLGRNESPRLLQVTLNWADYNLWSPDGRDQPSVVIRAVVQFLVARGHADDLPEQFDASLTRRHHRDADTVIPSMIGGS